MALQFGPSILGARLVLTDSGVRATLGRTQNDIRGTRAGLTSLGKDLKQTGQSFGSAATRALGFAAAVAGVSLGIVDAVRKFTDFETGIAKIGTLLPAGSDAMRGYGQQVIDLSTKFGQSATDVAEGMFQAISAAVPANKAQEFMAISAKAAAGGFTDMRTSVDGLTNVLNAYGLDVSEAQRVSDAFFVANDKGKTTFEELARSFGTVAPLAAAVGVNYRELTSAIAAVTKQGITTAETVTGLRQGIANIIKPSAEAAKLAEELGLQMGEQALKSKGLTGFMEALGKATSGSAETMTKLLGSVEAANIMLALSGKTGMATYRESLEAMSAAGGQTEKAFGVVAKTAEFKLKQLRATVDKMLIGVGEAIFEGLGGGPEALTKGVDRAIPAIKGAVKDFVGFMRRNLETIGDMIKFYFIGKGLGVIRQFARGAAGSMREMSIQAAIEANGGERPRDEEGEFLPDEDLARRAADTTSGRLAKAFTIMGNVLLVAEAVTMAAGTGEAIGAWLAGEFGASNEKRAAARSDVAKASMALIGSNLSGAKMDMGALAGHVARAILAGESTPSQVANQASYKRPDALGFASNAAIESSRALLIEKLMGQGRTFRDLRQSSGRPVDEEGLAEAIERSMREGLLDWLPELKAEGEKRAQEAAAKAAQAQALNDAVQTQLEIIKEQSKGLWDMFRVMEALSKPQVEISIDHKITDPKKPPRDHSLRASRGDGQARHLNPRYRAFVLRTGAGAGTVEPMPENYHGGHILNGGT